MMGLSERRKLLQKIQILNEGQDVSDMVYMSMRVSDIPLPHVPSTMRPCGTCKAQVWVDNRTLEHADSCKRIVCMHCFGAEIKEAK